MITSQPTVLDFLIEDDKTSLEIICLMSQYYKQEKSAIAGKVFADLCQMRDDRIIKQNDNRKWTITE